QLAGDRTRGLQDCYLRVGLGRFPELLRDFQPVRLAFSRPEQELLVFFRLSLGTGGQRADEGVDFPHDECALTWPRLDQSQVSEPLDRVSDRVARGAVALPQFELGPHLLAGLQYSALDLSAQLFGDLPVHRGRHGLSSVPARPGGRGHPACYTVLAVSWQ